MKRILQALFCKDEPLDPRPLYNVDVTSHVGTVMKYTGVRDVQMGPTWVSIHFENGDVRVIKSARVDTVTLFPQED